MEYLQRMIDLKKSNLLQSKHSYYKKNKIKNQPRPRILFSNIICIKREQKPRWEKGKRNVRMDERWKLDERWIPGHQLRLVEGSLSAKKRTKLALWFGASDLNLSNTLSKVETVATESFRGIFSDQNYSLCLWASGWGGNWTALALLSINARITDRLWQ